jgi:hypothetical protein
MLRVERFVVLPPTEKQPPLVHENVEIMLQFHARGMKFASIQSTKFTTAVLGALRQRSGAQALRCSLTDTVLATTNLPPKGPVARLPVHRPNNHLNYKSAKGTANITVPLSRPFSGR